MNMNMSSTMRPNNNRNNNEHRPSPTKLTSLSPPASASSPNFGNRQSHLLYQSEPHQHQYHNRIGSVRAMDNADNHLYSRRIIASSTPSIYGPRHGDDLNNYNSGPIKDRASASSSNDSDVGVVNNAFDRQAFMNAANHYNNYHNSEASSSSAKRNGIVDDHERTQMKEVGENSQVASGGLFQGEDTTVFHKPSDGTSKPTNNVLPAGHGAPSSSDIMAMLMMNSNDPLMHPGVTTDPNSLASYMKMGSMNMNMNMNMNTNMTGPNTMMEYGASRQGLTGNGMMNPYHTIHTPASNTILPSHFRSPQAFMTGFDSGAEEGMVSMLGKITQNHESRGLDTINNHTNLGGAGMYSIEAAMGMNGGLSAGSTMGMIGGMGTSQSYGHSLLPPRCKRGKQIKVKKKKPKDHPTRPLSAYNLFFKDERKRLLDSSIDDEGGVDNGMADTDDTKDADGGGISRKKCKPHGKIGFERMAKTIGARWRKIDPERLKDYQALAKKERERYGCEMKAYEKKLKDLDQQKKDEEEANKVDRQKKEEDELKQKKRERPQDTAERRQRGHRSRIKH